MSLTVYSRVTNYLRSTGTTGDEYSALLVKAVESLSDEERALLFEQADMVVELTGEYEDQDKAEAVMEELYS